MSDTPRVDAICKKRNCAYWGIPRSDAEEIERDLNVAIAERDALRANFQEYRDRAEQAERQLALQKPVMEAADIETVSDRLCLAWTRYEKNFGEAPHGTAVQLRALIQLAGGMEKLFSKAIRNLDGEPPKGAKMNDEQIKYMVNRFLGWRLPNTFSPDAGISFKKNFNEHTPHPMEHKPIGTNLFDAREAEAMVRYMVEGIPLYVAHHIETEAEKRARAFLATYHHGTPTEQAVEALQIIDALLAERAP